MSNYTVYMHISPSGKRYIGITSLKPKYRWNNGNGYKTQVFYRAIEKYGWDNIEHIIIAKGLDKETAEWLEIELIRELDTMNPNKGYNATKGGNTPNVTEETRQKMSESHKGSCHSEETKEKMSKNQQGEKNSMYGKSGELSPRYGVTLEEETRNKISNTRIERGVAKGSKNPSAKKVRCIELDMVFDTMKEASEYTNCNASNICNCCRGKLKTSGGYHWEYVLEVA